MLFLPAGAGWVLRRPGGERVLRLRAQAGVAPAGAGWGVSCSGTSNFLFCKKKVTKENHSNLRFKDPLAWGGFRRCGGESVSP